MRFKVGDRVKFVVAIDDKLQAYVGKTCQVRAVGPYKPGQRLHCDGYSGTTQDGCDYVVRFEGDEAKLVGPFDWQLQSLTPAKEPEAMRRRDEV